MLCTLLAMMLLCQFTDLIESEGYQDKCWVMPCWCQHEHLLFMTLVAFRYFFITCVVMFKCKHAELSNNAYYQNEDIMNMRSDVHRLPHIGSTPVDRKDLFQLRLLGINRNRTCATLLQVSTCVCGLIQATKSYVGPRNVNSSTQWLHSLYLR